MIIKSEERHLQAEQNGNSCVALAKLRPLPRRLQECVKIARINCLCLPQDNKGSKTSEKECRETFTRQGRKWELSLEFMRL